MNKLMVIVAMAFLFTTSAFSAGLNQEPQKSQVTFTLTFNSISFEDAAKKEKEIREKFKDACTLRVVIQETTNTVTSVFTITPQIQW